MTKTCGCAEDEWCSECLNMKELRDLKAKWAEEAKAEAVSAHSCAETVNYSTSGVCPHCGYCPTCGRARGWKSNPWTVPYRPWDGTGSPIWYWSAETYPGGSGSTNFNLKDNASNSDSETSGG